MIVVWTGLLAGSLHVVSGPDHIAALAPLATHQPRRALRLGVLWGLGHGLAVLALGVVGLLTREWVDIAGFSQWSEFVVGLLLIGMGLWSFRVAARITVHSHSHEHSEEEAHQHLHVHIGQDEHGDSSHRRHEHAAFGVGVLHGAAGAGHLFGVLPSLALEPEQAVAYLAAYFVAAVGSMALVGWGLGKVAGGRTTAVIRQLMWTCGLVSLGVGAYWLSLGTPLS
jgi:hypothetical protein